MAEARVTPPSLALGVARAGRSNFKVAVRIQQRSRTVDELLDTIRQEAVDEEEDPKALRWGNSSTLDHSTRMV